ncbi:serine hydrolase domain-containing protein [Phenylobacterium kunshanense]|uniref:Serine hydrolase n=1 Tax=Phenylobacterium kunshanense TaxID=1445034 RepID=A0A328BLG1_9CAUL|nr:serine hydrolase [Phenylobacterium kunshanense]RAK67469.1 serine hydrolase [Phenylobacterium kunshanense]
MGDGLDRRRLLLVAGGSALAWGAKAQPTEGVASSPLATTPENQAATFRSQDQTRPVRAIRCGTNVRRLRPHARQLSRLSYPHAGATRSLDDYMTRRRTGGVLVLKGGEIALERYGMGNGPESHWTSFSTAKSMTSTLAGVALQDGAIRSLDDPAERYLPDLSGSAYEGVTVRNLLRMTSGVAWKEDYDPTGPSDVVRLGAAMEAGRPGGVLALMRSLPRAAPQGARFNYSTGESCVLGAIVAAATGRSLADYYGEKVWGPAGMEADGYWQLESKDGLELGGLGVSARLRDFGRFGQFVLEDGVVGGRRILPVGWRDLAGQPDIEATGFGKLQPGYPLGYGYQWWVLPRQVGSVHDGAFTAQGIFGQFVYVHPREQVVAVVWSAWRNAWEDDAELETYALLGAAVEALRT